MTAQTAIRRLQGELAEEAQNFLKLLARHDAGEDVDGELYASIFHLGTHGSLLTEEMDEDAFAADEAEAASQSASGPRATGQDDQRAS